MGIIAFIFISQLLERIKVQDYLPLQFVQNSDLFPSLAG